MRDLREEPSGSRRHPDRVATEAASGSNVVSQGRIRWARAVAWSCAVFAALPFFGLIDLSTLLGLVDQDYVWAVPLEVSWGSLFTFVVAGSYVSIAVAPRRAQPGLVQLAIVVLALTLGAAGGLDPRPAYVAAAIAASVLLLGWLVRELDGWTPRWSPTALSVLVALVGAVLWLPYALNALGQSRTDGLGDITNGIEHWPVQGATGLALAIGAVVMAGWLPARPLFRVSISMSAVFIGMAGLAYPDRDGATQGLPWAVAVTVWGLLVAMTPTPTDAT